MTPRQPQFSVTTTYTDNQPPGYHAGTLKAVSTWLGRQVNLKDADIKPVAAQAGS
jgi:hypothetical protein